MNENSSDSKKLLRKDILNSPFHIFGDHGNCDRYFCKKDQADKNFIPEFTASGLWGKIMEIINNLADNCTSLLFDVSNNVVENFNSKITKFTGGKRVNFCMRNSYGTRCSAAALAHNTKTPKRQLYYFLHGSSPSTQIKSFEEKRKVFRKKVSYRRPRSLFETDSRSLSYGPKSEKPDISMEDFDLKKEEFLNDLQLSDAIREQLFNSTIEQHNSIAWIEERRKRLRASTFGQVCCRKPETGCENLVRSL